MNVERVVIPNPQLCSIRIYSSSHTDCLSGLAEKRMYTRRKNTWQDARVSAEERHVTDSQTRKIGADGLTSYSRLKIKIKH